MCGDLSAVSSLRFVSSAFRSAEFSDVGTIQNSLICNVSVYDEVKLRKTLLSKVQFVGSRQPVATNVLELLAERFETLSTEMLLTKITA